MCDKLLLPERSRLARVSSKGFPLKYGDQTAAATDQLESARDFLASIQQFVYNKAYGLSDARRRLGLPMGLDMDESVVQTNNDPHSQCKCNSCSLLWS